MSLFYFFKIMTSITYVKIIEWRENTGRNTFIMKNIDLLKMQRYLYIFILSFLLPNFIYYIHKIFYLANGGRIGEKIITEFLSSVEHIVSCSFFSQWEFYLYSYEFLSHRKNIMFPLKLTSTYAWNGISRDESTGSADFNDCSSIEQLSSAIAFKE